VVFDAQDAGWGCSTRNGGQISPSIKPSFSDLKALHGEDVAFRIRREGLNALEWIEDFIKRERIDCNYMKTGRFHAAHNAVAFKALAREAMNQPKGLAVEVQVVPRSDQRREIGSDFYHGGLVYPAHAALHAGKYHQGLLDRVEEVGVAVITRCPVTSIERQSSGFRLSTSRGKTNVREVIVATNGYTSRLTPWLRRRIMPIGSQIIATEAVGAALARRLIPNNRMVSDTRKLVFYYRLSEDGQRILFGGRAAVKEQDPKVSALYLHRHLTRIFPELAATKITHSWGGFVAYTFDALPHLGRDADGIYYCLGYCGNGISLASYFGTRLAQQLLGKPEGSTALDGLTFQTRPFYTGDPWFLPLAIAYYKLRDRLSF
jgi:glycine/D-amino acid oxidase-like deaminating enzyme